MKKTLLLAAILFFLPSLLQVLPFGESRWLSGLGGASCFAQFITIWTQTIDPSAGSDAPYAIAADASGIYVVGSDRIPGNDEWRIEKRNLTTGALDATFGGGTGVVASNPSVNDNEYPFAITADASGIYVAGRNNIAGAKWYIEKRALGTGAIIWTRTGSANGTVYGITADASGIYVAGSNYSPDEEWRIEKRSLTTGALIAAFGTSGVVTSDPSANLDRVNTITADASGIYLAGWDETLTNRQWRIEKRNLTTGALDAAFGTSGVITTNPSADHDEIYDISVDASGIYLVGMDWVSPGDWQWRIEKRDLSTGTLIPAFGTGGVVQNNLSIAAWEYAYGITANANGIYVVGGDGAAWYIEQRDLTTAAVLCSNWIDPSVGNDFLYGITADASGIYVAGLDKIPGNDEWRMEKYNLCVALPIELLSFDAIAENNSLVRCQWSTATEINNDYFAVERSQYGINFEQIGTVKGAGNSSTTLNYVFYDHEPYSGVSYYRLKQFDYNGAFTYSEIRPVYIGTIDLITIYPNPSADGSIDYIVASEDGGEVSVKVYDIIGRKVISNTETLEGGVVTKKLSTAGLSSGSYLLQVTNNNLEKTQKQFVIK